MLAAGADKVSLNTAAVADPELVRRVHARGRQETERAVLARVAPYPLTAPGLHKPMSNLFHETGDRERCRQRGRIEIQVVRRTPSGLQNRAIPAEVPASLLLVGCTDARRDGLNIFGGHAQIEEELLAFGIGLCLEEQGERGCVRSVFEDQGDVGCDLRWRQ